MLQRSTWSGLLLSAAVCTGAVLGVARGQQAAPAPAAGGAQAPGQNLAALADDFLHYSLVNNTELAKASAEALLNPAVPPQDVFLALDGVATNRSRDARDVMLQDQRRPDLKEVAQRLVEKFDDGYRAVARDPQRIRAEIDRLASGPRGYQNAKDRLVAAGQFAAPLFIEYLQNGAKRDLHPYILRVMGEIGRPLLTPLIEELRVSDPTLRIALIGVLGEIRYPQALPALRAMQADPATQGELRAAVDNAIRLIDRTGQAVNVAPAELTLKAAQNYYDKRPSYQPLLANEKTNPVWVFDPGLNNVAPIAVPTPIWNSVMALRLAEATLRQDGNNGEAISLWLAASLRREIQLPEGATDPTRGTGPDAAFYALAAGPVYVNPVLARALDAHDAALALRAIDALEATGGTTGLVANGENSPLVRALSYPDRAVRFRAAFALARANPASQFPSFFRVVPILAEAVNSTGSPTALVVSPNENERNRLADVLRGGSGHYTVFAGATLSDALEQSRRAPAVDVIVVPGGQDVGRVGELARSDYRLTGVPVLVTAPAANVANLKMQLGEMKGYGAIDVAADDAAIASALSAARADVGNVPVDADRATQFAATALELLGMLAADHRSIYPINEAVPMLAEALRDKRPEIATAATRVLGKINSADGEKALANAALAGEADASLRVVYFEGLAEAAKHTGNALDAAVVNSLIKAVGSESDPKVKQAAARALGALNVPSNQASTLILQQAK
jgi:hypothetical protein